MAVVEEEERKKTRYNGIKKIETHLSADRVPSSRTTHQPLAPCSLRRRRRPWRSDDFR